MQLWILAILYIIGTLPTVYITTLFYRRQLQDDSPVTRSNAHSNIIGITLGWPVALIVIPIIGLVYLVITIYKYIYYLGLNTNALSKRARQ